MKFLIDADLPRSVAETIRTMGFEAVDVRDIGLSCAEDSKIIDYASKNNFIIITKDSDFIELARFSSHKGIVHVRLPYHFVSVQLNYYIREFLKSVGTEDITGAISVITLDRFRIRK